MRLNKKMNIGMVPNLPIPVELKVLVTILAMGNAGVLARAVFGNRVELFGVPVVFGLLTKFA